MMDLVERLSELLTQRNMMVVTAESCTGGLIAATITQKSGASSFFERGFVTYSNEAKNEMLNVPMEMINEFGAVSPEVAEAMANGALANSHAYLAISVTGIAGPDGGTEEKPVGLVYFGCAIKDGSVGSINGLFDGNRKTIQTQSTITALKHLIKTLESI